LIFSVSIEGNRSLQKGKKEKFLVSAIALETPESLTGKERKVYQLLISHIQSKMASRQGNSI
jgi:hypothetical protein